MNTPTSNSPTNTKLLVFGPQAQTWNETSFAELRTSLHSSSECFHWVLDVLAELPSLWQDVSSKIPSLANPDTFSRVEQVQKYLTSDLQPIPKTPPPNAILTPLVVLSHLAHFTNFLDRKNVAQPTTSPFWKSPATLGLCTGLLSALAVSASSTKAELAQWGPVAVRLALLVGAAVDADDNRNEAQSFTVTWPLKESIAALTRIVEQNEQRYVSVRFDDRRATVTTAKVDANALVSELRAAGLGVSEIRLKGRFHSDCHEEVTAALISYCNDHFGLQLPPLSALTLPTILESDLQYSDQDRLHIVALRAVLTQQAKWYESWLQAQSALLQPSEGQIACFGPERCVPPSLLPELNAQVTQIQGAPSCEPCNSHIAVVGMACRVPGAEDLDQFSALLRQGQSQHMEVPKERFDMDTHWRPLDGKRRWYGNFLDDIQSFDHKFFKKTPREAASMDPQHRLILQAAYQAIEQSGYFNGQIPDKHIGCFLGVGLVDYENNIACHPANAYSATGNLKSFAAGRISHYFGWTGPALTVDTACSSAAVAVHQACRAIQHGECSTALAGAVNLMTSPDWFHNLAGASFLSPTGQCKPFDKDADGYCRGEAVGTLVLKSYAAAVADNDPILGVIAGSEVFQNENCTPITVPNAISLSSLFRTVVEHAGLQPGQVSVVEAHGTGTPVGDPAEYDSIKQVFASSGRSNVVSLGSVKGLVGHGEPASGMTALIKVLLMAREGFIPPQPSHKAINPSINIDSKIEIATKVKQWVAEPRVALINNYGASGSNASLVVMQKPSQRQRVGQANTQGTKYPFWLSGFDQASLRRYASILRQFIAKQEDNCSLAALSFSLSRQSNRTLEQAAIFSSSNINDLDAKLASIEQGTQNPAVTPVKEARPVILCFGGQISTYLGLEKAIYDSVCILRHHLNACNEALIRLGLPPIYPGIFQRSRVESIVQLQAMLFSLQYSCARTWIDCGLSVAAVVGHSFGELTALSVSGGMTLSEALRMIAGRAQLIEQIWQADGGQMMAVEGDLEVVEQLVKTANNSTSNAPANIACYNGPRTFTLAGSTQSIEKVVEVLKDPQYSASIRGKKLNVTNAFHSALVDPLVPGLKELGDNLEFKKPSLLWERAIESETQDTPLTGDYVADHMRNPVHFDAAIQRLAKRHPSAIWLEAGSNSTITSLASRVLGPEGRQSSHFQPVNITSDGAFSSLVDATTSLWSEGVKVNFWPHHPVQSHDYSSILLPPYQFERSPHWMELKKVQVTEVIREQPVEVSAQPDKLWTAVKHPDIPPRGARFQILTESTEYQNLLAGHVVVQAGSICPSVFQIEIAFEALSSLRPEFQDGSLRPQLYGMQSHGPMGRTQSGASWLDFKPLDEKQLTWEFRLGTETRPGAKPTPHASGQIHFVPAQHEQTQAELQRFERLVSHSRCCQLLDGHDADEAMQGRSIYKAFSEIVDYSPSFKGLRKIVSSGSQSAGQVERAFQGTRYIDTGLLGAFCQVAGLYINCMTDVPEGDMYISDRIERWMRAPRLHLKDSAWPEKVDVFATSEQVSDREMLSDVYVFDPVKGDIIEVILGIHYQRIPRALMRQVVAKIPRPPSSTGEPPDIKGGDKPDIFNQVRGLLCDLSGMDPEEVHIDTGLGDIGIDSLMGMEVAREIETTFECSLDVSELENLTDVASLLRCIEGALGYDTEGAAAAPSPAPSTGAVGIDNTLTTDGVTMNSTQAGNDGPSEEFVRAATDSFAAIKRDTDDWLARYGLADYCQKILPQSTELCIIHILDAFDALGCSLRNASTGDSVPRANHLSRHTQFVDFVYGLLEEAGLVTLEGTKITRTAAACPQKPAGQLLQELLADRSDHSYDHHLTWLVGERLADCLVGKADGVQLIFGSPEGREAATGMYSRSPINLPWIKQMETFLHDYVARLGNKSGPIRILEMGAGTGGTTAIMAPVLGSLGVDLVYTATDLSSSLVAGLRKRFKQYPFMNFKTCNIEDSPPQDLLASQHIVLATNCVHATHDLLRSTTNIHRMLRPDGLLMMLEMTLPIPWVDLVFGLVEGWWLFNDGRTHALAPPEVWERTLYQAGYGTVDWTDGARPEAAIQRVIMAMASPSASAAGPRYDFVSSPVPPASVSIEPTPADRARQETIDSYVEQYTAGFSVPSVTGGLALNNGISVLVTGATGSLGSHLVAHLARLEEVTTVVCLNRPRGAIPEARQKESFKSRGIQLDSKALDKINVFQSDTSKPLLGLTPSEYEFLRNNITHIVHNAWPMSISRGIEAFTAQFQTLRNLLDLAAQAAARRPTQVGFQFISSIATVGQYSRRTGQTRVPETRMSAGSALCTGYSEAKLVCEYMLEKTLQKYPEQFRSMSVRIGQIAGSRNSGHWNPVEHLAFMLKSSQSLGCLPRLEGTLSWCPVDIVAGTLSDLLFQPEDTCPSPIYHIENPTRQPWPDMLRILSKVLNAPEVIPFKEWTAKVRSYPGTLERNPAARLADFLDEHFVAMSCGELVLDTIWGKRHSGTLTASRAVREDLVRLYVRQWKEMGFLM